MLPTTFRFIWPNGFRGEESKKSANQKQESPVTAMFVADGDVMSNLYRGPSIDASYQALVHLAKRFQRRRFLKICIKINAFWIQISIFKQEYLSFHRRYFRNQPIWNKNCLWQPCLLTNRDKMNTLYRGPSIDASYQVSVHLDKRFQRRRFLEICLSETRIACGGHVC